MSNLHLVAVSDIYVAAFLLCSGEKYHHVKRTVHNARRKVVFYFGYGVQEVIDGYFNGDQCSAIAFRNAVENIKSIIYDFE